MENLNSIRVFVHVAQTRSFKEAAARLGLTSSAVSKAITRLEAEMGVRLLQRTTRSVGLSNDGEIFFQRCRQILDELESAETMLNRAAAGPYGQLRIHMSVAIGSVVVMPAIGQFIERHPSLTVNAELSDRHVDMAYEGFDVSIQIGEVADARLIARPLGQLRFVACASPEYLARYGEPATPAGLDDHHCLAYTHIHSGRFREWHFKENGKVIDRTVSGRLNVNNAQALVQAAMSGLGIAFVSNFVAAEALASGRLRTVLADYETPGPPVSAVYLPSHHQSPKVRAFVDFLAELIKRRPDWSQRADS
jgi:LysR family transcriptional regulator for bpeEF and oprC